MNTQRRIIDTGASKSGEGGKGTRAEKLPFGYGAHYLGDGYTMSPDFTCTQYMN